ncbi:hypothetical protein BDV93DRAFT_504533 [Ceratobasidium sp. AG-I]|nr:hypothetical protein BDV93DRAFT_504533 [Ceratobasidium sp. AG-I]
MSAKCVFPPVLRRAVEGGVVAPVLPRARECPGALRSLVLPCSQGSRVLLSAPEDGSHYPPFRSPPEHREQNTFLLSTSSYVFYCTLTTLATPVIAVPKYTMHPPTRHISEVPELIGLICGFVENSSLVNLSTVSRGFFHCAAPLIWKEVTGLAKLLTLLPRLELDFPLEELPTVGPDHIRPCDQDQLVRFNLYAPFIQRLESNFETDAGSLSWDLLLSRVPTRPLLPNLRALAIKPSFKQSSTRFIEYVDAFLCPTLSGIRTSWDWNQWINPFEARSLMVRMTATCPGLTKLNILPGNSRHPENLLSFSLYSPVSIFTPLSQFRDLRVLHSSSAVLNPEVLQLLGNLPCLESLAVYSLCTDNENWEDDDIPIANLTLPNNSFPSLRNLKIDCVPGAVVSKLWQTPPLVRDLVSVRIQFMADDTESPSELVCTICQGSPHITDLELDLSKTRDTEISSVVVEHLHRLPLLHLRIWEGEADVQPLILALPNLEYLNIESMHVNFEELALIAKHMPKLQYLFVGMLLWNWPDESELPRDSSSSSPCYIDSQFSFEEDFDFDVDDPAFSDEIDGIARGLHALWPRGVRCGFGNWVDPGDNDPATLNRVNKTTKALSAASALHIPTPEESSSRWVYGSWKSINPYKLDKCLIFIVMVTFIERKNLANLLTVSRPFFYCVVPLIWKEVSGVVNITRLLPNRDEEAVLQVSPNDQLARFNIYAPFIQKLESNTEIDLSSLGWDLLLARASARPLLPNLRALAISPCLFQPDYKYIEYVNAFLCSALSDIRTSWRWNLWMNPFKARDLLVRLAASCPNLTKLNILPGNSRYPDRISLSPYPPAGLFTPFGQFRDIRVLHSSSVVLSRDVLQLLGDLPRLESLGAYSISTDGEADDDEILITGLTLPEHSFPALRHLAIDYIPGTVVSKLWQTPPLVRNLVSVKIQFIPDDTESPNDLTCIICQGSPQTTDLELNLAKIREVQLSSAVLDHFRRLPLLRLRVWGAHANASHLIFALPNLEYLEMESMHVDLEEFTLIPKHMSRLQYLSIGLPLWSLPDISDLPQISPSPSPCHLDSQFAFDKDSDENDPYFNVEVDDVARALHTLWPKGVRCGFRHQDIYPYGASDPATLEYVNETTRALSATSAVLNNNIQPCNDMEWQGGVYALSGLGICPLDRGACTHGKEGVSSLYAWDSEKPTFQTPSYTRATLALNAKGLAAPISLGTPIHPATIPPLPGPSSWSSDEAAQLSRPNEPIQVYFAHRVYEVPELLELICSFVEKSTLANLLTVSQQFFHCAAPLVWKEVSGVANVLGLLPPLEQELDLEQFLEVGLDGTRSTAATKPTGAALSSHLWPK